MNVIQTSFSRQCPSYLAYQESGFISFPICYFNTETFPLERKLFSLQYLREYKMLIYSIILILHWPEYSAQLCFQPNGLPGRKSF